MKTDKEQKELTLVVSTHYVLNLKIELTARIKTKDGHFFFFMDDTVGTVSRFYLIKAPFYFQHVQTIFVKTS